MPDPCAMVMSKTVWRRHSTRPSLPAGTARKASGHLSGRRPLHLANARPFGRLKAPLGLSLLRCAAQTRACLGRRNKLILQERKTGSSHWGTPCCTYRYRLWLFAGCVRVGAPCFFTMLHHFLRAASGIRHQHGSGSDAAHPGIVPIFCAGMPCKLARKQCHFPAYFPIFAV